MLLKQISTGTVFGDKAAILKTVMTDEKREHFLYRVFGAIDAFQVGKGKHQRVNPETKEAEDTFWTRFYGEFYAVNSRGEEFEASTLFLPDYVSGGFKTQLENGITGITFAYDIFGIFSAKSITSYEFVASLVKPASEEKSMIEKLAENMPALPSAGNRKALPGPKKK